MLDRPIWTIIATPPGPGRQGRGEPVARLRRHQEEAEARYERIKTVEPSAPVAYHGEMADVLFVVLILGLFAMAGLLVAGCDRIIGPSEQLRDPEPAPPEELAV